MTAITLTLVGVDYCTLHHALRNEDEQWCDRFGNDLCLACDGSGYAEEDEFGGFPEEDEFDGFPDCPECQNYGVTLCHLVPLGYVENGSTGDPR